MGLRLHYMAVASSLRSRYRCEEGCRHDRRDHFERESPAVGGLKEKALAALRNKVKEVIIPYMNKKDLIDLPLRSKENQLYPVKHMMSLEGRLAENAPFQGSSIKSYWVLIFPS